jgi:hypothetical protein
MQKVKKHLGEAAVLDRAKAFSAVTGGRPTSFHGVTEWGTRWPRAAARGTARGEVNEQAVSLWNERKGLGPVQF